MKFSAWLRSKLGTSKWVIAARLTPKLKARGYTLAISEDRFRELESEFNRRAEAFEGTRYAEGGAVKKITVEPKNLIAALKAVREFVSEDSTRAGIRNVLVEAFTGYVVLTATDGHTLCSATVKCNVIDGGAGTVRLNDAAVDAVITFLKNEAKTLAECEVELLNFSNAPFPAYRDVLPSEQPKNGKADSVYRLNALYLARVGHVQKTLKAPNAVFQFTGNCDAVRADVKGDLASAVVIVMPCRV
jgi:hypothetical protein